MWQISLCPCMIAINRIQFVIIYALAYYVSLHGYFMAHEYHCCPVTLQRDVTNTKCLSILFACMHICVFIRVSLTVAMHISRFFGCYPLRFSERCSAHESRNLKAPAEWQLSRGQRPQDTRRGYDNKSEGIIAVSQCLCMALSYCDCLTLHTADKCPSHSTLRSDRRLSLNKVDNSCQIICLWACADQKLNRHIVIYAEVAAGLWIVFLRSPVNLPE